MKIQELSELLRISEKTISSNFVRLQDRYRDNYNLLIEKTGRGKQTEYYVSELVSGALQYYKYKKDKKTESQITEYIKEYELENPNDERWDTRTVALAFDVTEDKARQKLVKAWISQMK